MRKNMKYILLAFVTFGLFSTEMTAQEDFRNQAPEAGPARKIEIGKYESFELDNGLKIIVVENHKVPRISYKLFIDRDQIVEGDKAGYVSCAGSLLKTGTETRSKSDIDEAVDFVGGSMSTNSRGGFASSLTKHSDGILEIFADVILNPTFPEEEYDKWKTQTISGLQTNKDDPNAIAGNVSGALVYGLEHPYGEMMTENTVESFTLEDCKEYYSTYFKPNNAYMVVVGDITPGSARKKVEKYFGDWEAGDMPTFEYEFPEIPESRQVAFVDKTGAVQSVINVTHPIDLKPGADDVIPARVTNTILGSGLSGRLFRNLREDKAYTYAAYSSLGNDELVARFNASASVRNEVTDSAVTEFLYELNKMRDSLVEDNELDLAKNYIAGSFARNLESPQTVADFALNTSRFDLPEDYYSSYLERLEKVTSQDVQAMAQKYIDPSRAIVVVVGNKGEVAEKLEQFDADGEVTFYDIYAKEMAPAEDAGDVSGEDVVKAYIEALGGQEAFDAVKSMKQEMSGEVMGQPVVMTEYRMAPDKFSVVMNMSGQQVMRQAYNGESGYVEQMGQRQAMDDAMLADAASQAKLVPEMDYLGDDYELTVDGIEEVNGEKCYKLVVKDPAGATSTEFYSVDSGLKMKMVKTQEANGQSITTTAEYGDYKEVDGIMIPHSQKVTGAMPVPLDFKVTTVEINGDVDPEMFN